MEACGDVGATRFELAAPWSQTRYSTKLSHAPNAGIGTSDIIFDSRGFVNSTGAGSPGKILREEPQ